MAPIRHEVFLSFKGDDKRGEPTRDQELALQLYRHLTEAGLSVFFSPVSLEQLGASEFKRAIEQALEDATVLVVVGTLAENLDSRWVRHEWESFQSEILGERKPDGRLFTYLEGTDHRTLPSPLRQITAIQHDPPRSLDKLLGFIRSGDARAPERPAAPDPVDVDPSHLLRGEWIVREAQAHESFVFEIRHLHDCIQDQIEGLGTELVITMYARSFPVVGVGKFEYDLIYYRNIFDDAPMFGPLVTDDDRRAFARSPQVLETGVPTKPAKAGGFIDREKIESFAKVKLGPDLWGPEEPHEGPATDVVGLLFINGRKFPLPAKVFAADSVRRALSRLAESLDQVRGSRRNSFDEKSGRVITGLPLPLEDASSPAATSTFFGEFAERLNSFTGYQDLAFTAYLATQSPTSSARNLHWLWSDGPTSTPATLRLARGSAASHLLVADVATDPNHKPLLVHNVREKPAYQDRLVQTRLGDDAQVNLVIPVLSSDDARLLGLIDIQATDPQQFDTDDVQLLYSLSELRLADAMLKLLEAHQYGRLPLHNEEGYAPFDKGKLDFPVDALLALGFNPMKFLLHWDKVRELILTDETRSPATVEVWPNMVCTHRCAWCRTEKDRKLQKRHKKEMTQDELRGIARDIQKLKEVDVLVSGGGEPLLHSGMGEFIDLVADIDGTIGIFTNGTRPDDFRFWVDFFRREDRHRFVRVSFNGHDPESYFRIHFDSEEAPRLPPNYRERYAEARKIVLDLLGMRTARSSVAIGDTVQYHEIPHVKTKAEHAERLGVDFIQMRPELYESSHYNKRGFAVCDAVREVAPTYEGREDFAVVHTDGERSFVSHDEPRCYAMHLVPTLVPDSEEGWTRVMPCSYAINTWGRVPDLGRMREGKSLSEFWRRMNQKLSGGRPSDPDYEVTIERHIDPRIKCPQCRYYRLNKRLDSLVQQKDKLHLIDQLVDSLKTDPDAVDKELSEEIQATWPPQPRRETGPKEPRAEDRDRGVGDAHNSIIDIPRAQEAFKKAQELRILPSF